LSLNHLLAVGSNNTLNDSIELQVFLDCQSVKDSIKLRAVAYEPSRLSESTGSSHIEAIHADLPLGRHLLAREALEGRGLACTRDAQEGKALAILEPKTYSIDCKSVSVVLLNLIDLD